MKNYKVGYTAGVFDMFHIGHLNILRRAKEMCDYLIVGVTSDEECYRTKNKFPIISYSDRKQIIESIRFVDMAIIEKNVNKTEALKDINFNVIFKGSDWKGSKIWNEYEKFFHEKNIDVVYLPYTNYISSSLLREKLL